MNNNIFLQRIECWKDTLDISNKLLNPQSPSLKLKYDDKFNLNKKYEKSNIKFFDMDSIDCCLLYDSNALVLNLADNNFPGGCVEMGSGAQEESLFRRTNYCKSLNIKLYPLKNDEIIYSPLISVIKTNEATGWKLLDLNNPPKISFIACPGIKYPDLITINNEARLNDTDIEILQNKIKTIIQTAIKFNHDTIIFGAMGCGAWQNPTKHVAEIFKEVLQIYDGTVLNFYFAIMSTTNDNYIVRNRDNKKKKSVEIFSEVFN